MMDKAFLQQAMEEAIAKGDFENAYKIEQQMKAAPDPEPKAGGGLQHRLVNWVGNAIKGDAAEDLPNINQAGMDNFGTGMASMFGSDEDYVNSLQNSGYQIEQDANGNQVAVGPDGQRAYVNQPGLDLEDVTRFAGKALSFTPAGRLGAWGANLATKAGLMTAGATATDVGMQKLAGKESVDPVQAVTSGVAGGAAEVVAPAAGYVGRKIADFLRKSDFSPDAGRQALMQAGATAEDVANLPDGLLAKVARQGVHVDDSVRWEARVAEAQGLKPTRAQQTDQNWRIHEQAMEADDSLRNFQNEGVKDLAQDTATSIGGQGSAIRAQEAAMQGIGSEARRRANQVDDAYDAARAEKGSVSEHALSNLDEATYQFKVNNNLRETPTKRDLMGGTYNAMDDITHVTQKAMDLMQKPGTLGVDLPFEEVEMIRRGLLQSRSAAKNPNDARLVGDLTKQFDEWFEQSIDEGLFSGSPDFLNAIQSARGLNAQFKNDFAERWMRHGSDRIGKTLEQLRYGEISIDQAADVMLGARHINPGTALEYARRLKGVVPGETYQAFKEAAFRKLLVNPKTGNALDERSLLNNLQGVLNKDGAYYKLFKEVLSSEERQRLHAMATGIQGLLRKSAGAREAGRSSGTAERIFAWMNQRAGGIPLVQIVPNMMKNVMQSRYTKQGLMQDALPGTTMLPAMAPAATY